MSKIKIVNQFKAENPITLFNGDCFNLLKKMPNECVDLIVTSPPYCMKKPYEDSHDDIAVFKEQHLKIFSDIYRVLKPNGSICWQVGYHVSNACVVPLDYIIYEIFTSKSKELEHPLILRNRIIWSFGHGQNSTDRFSGRHETILWFTKGANYDFSLDCVRVPQKYPGKKHIKGQIKAILAVIL